MPPPMPLSAGRRYSAGSQAWSASSSAKSGRIHAIASSGDEAASIAARALATNVLIRCVSRTKSSRGTA